MKSGAAEKFQEQDHLVLLIGRTVSAAAAALLKFGHPSRELSARSLAPASRFQNARPEKLGDVLELVAGKTIQKCTGFGLQGSIGTRREGGY